MTATVTQTEGRRARRRIRSIGARTALAAMALAAGYGTALAATRESASLPGVVVVTAGKPTELAFTLSKASALPWKTGAATATVTFKVTNRGSLPHQFTVCSKAVPSAKLNSCTGAGTKLLGPGETVALKVTFRHPGTYEYLSKLAGEAAKGMKGLIGVGVSLGGTTPSPTTTPASTVKTSTATPTTTTATTTPAATTTSSSDAAAGAAVWSAGECSTCHTVGAVQAASGGTISPALNSSHTGGPFPNGPLSATQIQQLQAFINGH